MLNTGQQNKCRPFLKIWHSLLIFHHSTIRTLISTLISTVHTVVNNLLSLPLQLFILLPVIVSLLIAVLESGIVLEFCKTQNIILSVYFHSLLRSMHMHRKPGWIPLRSTGLWCEACERLFSACCFSFIKRHMCGCFDASETAALRVINSCVWHRIHTAHINTFIQLYGHMLVWNSEKQNQTLFPLFCTTDLDVWRRQSSEKHFQWWYCPKLVDEWPFDLLKTWFFRLWLRLWSWWGGCCLCLPATSNKPKWIGNKRSSFLRSLFLFYIMLLDRRSSAFISACLASPLLWVCQACFWEFRGLGCSWCISVALQVMEVHGLGVLV